MKTNYKPRYARCVQSEFDNAVEPHQVMSIQDMLVAYTKGMPLPDKYACNYDEDINIDDVGYSCGDRLEAVDYLNAVNQRIASAKAAAKQTNVSNTTVETPNTETNE